MKKNKAIIKFTNVSKDFDLTKQKTFKEYFQALLKRQETKLKYTALENISFEVKKGEVVGIIGPNGSGKSTILKLIAGVTIPSAGKIFVNGRISPLIELGAGFHPELSGRENVYLNATILGLKQKEIHENFDKILDFAEIGEFINEPVKHYSSGMYMRLAFSVAIHCNPEILIVDEILAVGDAAFQEKCFKRMNEFKNNGTTIIMVSHSLQNIRNFCNKAIYINNHNIQAIGNVDEVCDVYTNNQNANK